MPQLPKDYEDSSVKASLTAKRVGPSPECCLFLSTIHLAKRPAGGSLHYPFRYRHGRPSSSVLPARAPAQHHESDEGDGDDSDSEQHLQQRASRSQRAALWSTRLHAFLWVAAAGLVAYGTDFFRVIFTDARIKRWAAFDQSNVVAAVRSWPRVFCLQGLLPGGADLYGRQHLHHGVSGRLPALHQACAARVERLLPEDDPHRDDRGGCGHVLLHLRLLAGLGAAHARAARALLHRSAHDSALPAFHLTFVIQ